MRATIISTCVLRLRRQAIQRRAGAAFIGVLLATPAFAQQFDIPTAHYPSLPAQAGTVERFVPEGWHLETQLRGDLNKDGIMDRVLILHEADPANAIEHGGAGENPLDTNPRILAVVFGRKKGGYTLAMANHTLIPRRVDPTMDDPLDSAVASGITVAKGTLQVALGRFFSAGGWGMGNSTFTFRWQDGAFKLIGYDSTSIQRNTGETETLSVNYLTRRAKHAHGTIDSDAETVSWTKLKPAPLLRLDEVGDGLAFDPDGGS